MRTASLALLFAACAVAETWTGTVVDIMCKGRDLAGHTRECALTCAKSGFGLVLADGKFVKFDEAGNSRTLALLKKSTKEKELKAKVSGVLENGVIQVESVELQ